MSALAADLLTAKIPIIERRWRASIIGAATPPALQIDLSTMAAAVRGGDLTALVQQAQEEGCRLGLAGLPAQEVVAMGYDLTRIVADAIWEDFSGPPRVAAAVGKALDEMARQFLGGLAAGHVQGYDEISPRNSARDHELVKRLAQLAALHKVIAAANSSLDLKSTVNLAAEAVAEVMKVDVCSIWIYDRQAGNLVLRATKGLNAAALGKARLRVGEGVTGWAAREGRPLAVRDAWKDPRFKEVPALQEEALRSILAVPIILFTVERLVGVISVETLEYRDFRDDECNFLEVIAGQLAIAIENAQLYEQTDERLQQTVSELTALQGVSRTIAATLNLDHVLNLIVTQAVGLLNVDKAAIFTLNEDGDRLQIAANHGLGEPYARSVQLQVGEGVVGWVVNNMQPMVVEDTLAEPRLAWVADEIAMAGYRSMLSVPLVGPHGAIGGLCVYTDEPRHFGEEQVQLATAFAAQAAIAIENARLYEEARRGLEVKSTLLQEMHHRVRNNLQTVAALLSMQQRRAESAEVAAPLAESVARIQSIAAVHDLLCREDIGVTTVHEIAKQVVEIVRAALLRPDLKLQWDLAQCDVAIGGKEATLLALLITELLSNSLIHGFKGRRQGRVAIRAWRERRREVVEVRDDGRGFPSGFDPERSGRLGLQIVQMLVTKDLGGTLELVREDGWTVARLSFLAEERPE